MRSTCKIKTRTLPIALLIAFSLTACSTRQIYRTSGSTPSSSNAININSASVDEIEKLPHIGRKTAENIVQFRTDNGPFRRPEHMLQIRGVSEKRFVEIRQFLRTE